MNKQLFGPEGFEGTGYRIEGGTDGYRWVWVEPGEDDDFGDWVPSRSEAYLAAAEDWRENGSSIFTKDKLTNVLNLLSVAAR